MTQVESGSVELASRLSKSTLKEIAEDDRRDPSIRIAASITFDYLDCWTDGPTARAYGKAAEIFGSCFVGPERTGN